MSRFLAAILTLILITSAASTVRAGMPSVTLADLPRESMAISRLTSLLTPADLTEPVR